MTEAESNGLEASAGVYHGCNGPETPVVERVPGHGKSSPTLLDKGTYIPERWRADSPGCDREAAEQELEEVATIVKPDTCLA